MKYVVTGAAGFIGSHRVYNIGGGAEASLRDAIAALETLAGRRLNVRAHGPARGDPGRTSADTAHVEADLDWRARANFDDGVRAQWEWTLSRQR
jgi:nucleoside-diphosphate-sugar epimerase